MNKKQLNQILDAMGISKNTLEETNMDNKTKLETALTDLITAVHEVCKNCKYLDICGNAFKSAPQCFFTNLRKVSKSPTEQQIMLDRIMTFQRPLKVEIEPSA